MELGFVGTLLVDAEEHGGVLLEGTNGEQSQRLGIICGSGDPHAPAPRKQGRNVCVGVSLFGTEKRKNEGGGRITLEITAMHAMAIAATAAAPQLKTPSAAQKLRSPSRQASWTTASDSPSNTAATTKAASFDPFDPDSKLHSRRLPPAPQRPDLAVGSYGAPPLSSQHAPPPYRSRIRPNSCRLRSKSQLTRSTNR